MEGATTLNQYIISNWVLEYRNTSKSTELSQTSDVRPLIFQVISTRGSRWFSL